MARLVHLSSVHDARDPRILLKECASLRKAGHDVHLVARQAGDAEVEGVRIHGLDRPGVVGGRGNMLHRLSRIVRCGRLARELKADVYHVHDPELIPVGAWLKRTSGAKVIYDMHEDYGARRVPVGPFLRGLERWCFSWADHVFLAEEGYAPVVADRHVPHTYLLNYFLAPDTLVPRVEAQEPRRVLLYAGTVSNARGLGAALDLASLIRDRGADWQIHLVGKCHLRSEREAAEARIRSEGLERIVRRTGWSAYVPWLDMQPYFAQATLGLALFLPSRNSEVSIATKFYEYMAYGLPIVCSDFPLWRQFVERNRCGAAVDAQDPLAVFGAIEALDGRRRSELSQTARDASKAYRWEAMEPRLLEVYRTLLEEGGRA